MPQKRCIFCEILTRKEPSHIIKTFEHCYAIYDQFPVLKGHVLLIPHTHIDNWFAASSLVQLDMMQALNSMKALLDEKFNPEGYNIGLNCGAVAGQTVFHLHMHLIPVTQEIWKTPKAVFGALYRRSRSISKHIKDLISLILWVSRNLPPSILQLTT